MIVRKVKCNRLCGLGMWPCLENVCRILRGNPVESGKLKGIGGDGRRALGQVLEK